MPATNRTRAKRWVFTLNNYTEGEKQLLCDLCDSDHVKYGVLGYETGESGTPHIQGYVIFADTKSFTQTKALVGDRAHLEVSRGTPKEASDYCKKDGDFDEFGELEVSQGKRSDWDRLKQWCLEQNFMPTDRALFLEFPTLMGRYQSGVRAMCNALIGVDSREIGQPRPWQRQLELQLDGEPHERRIKFVVDEAGNSGKSWFKRYYALKHPNDVQMLSIGKRDDIAHALDPRRRTFLLDVPRGSMEYLQYSILEMIKDQVVFSPKYDSQTKILESPAHVVVFSNEHPDMDKLTRDRYEIIYPEDINTHLNRAAEREGGQDQ